jgi:hypothetical protein
MGSGINSTFRQVGIATGIAALGSIFSSAVRSHVASGLAAAHQSGSHAITTAITSGQIQQAIAHVPPRARAAVGEIVRTSFVDGLNEIFLVAAIVALVGAAGAFLLIRSSDFVAQSDAQPDLSAAQGSAAAAGS